MSSASFSAATFYPDFTRDNCQNRPRRHECTICRKRFSRPSALQTHILTHTGEKPFQCHYSSCGRRFTVISNIRRHYRAHSNVENPRHRLSAGIRQQFIERLIEKTQRKEFSDVDFARYHSSETSYYAPRQLEDYSVPVEDEGLSILPNSNSSAGGNSCSSSVNGSPRSQRFDSIPILAPLPPSQSTKVPVLEPFTFSEPFNYSPTFPPFFGSFLQTSSPFSSDYPPSPR